MKDTPQRLTPRRMGEIANRLAESIKHLREWGIRVIDAGRLTQTVKTLQKVSDLDTFPNDQETLRTLANAARDAQEFTEISDVLPDEDLRPLAESLQQSVGGTIGASKNTAAQFQSELWVGAMLANSGVTTSVVTAAAGKRPDFVVHNGNRLYPIEVKRPAGKLNPSRLVAEAVRQTRGQRYHGAAIVVDLSDCLPDAVAHRFGTGDADRSPVESEVIRLAGALNNEIFDDTTETIRKDRESVFALVTFGRSIYWNMDDLSQMHLFRFVTSVAFYRHNPNNLRGYRARALAEMVHAGIRAVGHQDLGMVDIAFPNDGNHGV